MKAFECHICSRVLSNKHNLARQMRCVHHGLCRMQCDICSKWFANKFGLLRHEKRQHFKSPIILDGTIVSSHVNSVEEGTITPSDMQCKECLKVFKYKRALNNHKQKHLNIKVESDVSKDHDESPLGNTIQTELSIIN